MARRQVESVVALSDLIDQAARPPPPNLAGDSSFLELEGFEQTRLKYSVTTVDRFFGGEGPHDWIQTLYIVNYFVAFVAVGAIIGVLVAAWLTYTNKRARGWLKWAFYFTFFSTGVFIVMMCAEMWFANFALQGMGYKLQEYYNWPEQLKQAALGEASIINGNNNNPGNTDNSTNTGSTSTSDPTNSTAALVGIGATSRLGVQSTATAKLRELQVLTTTEPVFCELTFVEGDDAHNRYPFGSPVHAYNMRRIADVETTEESPELAYIRELISSPTYAGGMTTEQAAMFGAISNECEEFHGDITQCCDPSQGLEDLQVRCPGRVLKEEQNNNYCQCVEVMTHLGLIVEDADIGHCTFYARDEVKKFAARSIGADLQVMRSREDLQQVYGCANVYDAEVVHFFSGAELHSYYDEPLFEDHLSFPESSMYAARTGGAGKVEWQLHACKEGPTTFQFRTSNTGETRPVNVLVDDVPITTDPIDVPATPVATWSKDTVIVSHHIGPGDHRVAIQAASADAGLPNVHRLAVCEDGGTAGCPTMPN